MYVLCKSIFYLSHPSTPIKGRPDFFLFFHNRKMIHHVMVHVHTCPCDHLGLLSQANLCICHTVSASTNENQAWMIADQSKALNSTTGVLKQRSPGLVVPYHRLSSHYHLKAEIRENISVPELSQGNKHEDICFGKKNQSESLSLSIRGRSISNCSE